MKEIYNNFRDEIIAVNHELLLDMPEDVILLKRVFNHIFKAGGKRLRPLMTLVFGRKYLNDRCNASTIYLAAAVELIHTATLLHDDVIDNAITRRNIPTANSIWDNKTSILVGDNMFSKAFQLIVKSGKIRAFQELANASATISAAEVWQIQILNSVNITIDEYIRLVTEKTAVLFAAACAVGVITSDLPDDIVTIARNFGLNFGILYQIRDDLLDYFGDEGVIGKEIFQDIREGKVTLPLIMLLQRVSQDEFALVTSMVGSKEVDRNLLHQLMEKYSIKAGVLTFAEQYKYAALDCIQDDKLLGALIEEIALF
jgi:octaprenyl-diphosphate synthase